MIIIGLIRIIVAGSVEQEHGGSRLPATTDPDSAGLEAKPAGPAWEVL